MNFSPPIATAPSVVPSFPDSGHTYVSCPHQGRRYQRNTLLPKNDCPNMASFSDAETAETVSLMSDLSASPKNLIPTASVVSSLQNAHGPVEHSIPPLHTLQIYRWPVPQILRPLLPLHAKSEIGTSAPIQCGTDNAIENVITYEIGYSLFPPFHSKLRQQLDARIAVSGFISHTHSGPA